MLALRGRCGGVLGMLALTSCGVWQTTKDATASVGKAIFIAKVEAMNVEIESHDALNQDHDGRSLPVVLRFYQLRDASAFEKASDAQRLTLAAEQDLLEAGGLMQRLALAADSNLAQK